MTQIKFITSYRNRVDSSFCTNNITYSFILHLSISNSETESYHGRTCLYRIILVYKKYGRGFPIGCFKSEFEPRNDEILNHRHKSGASTLMRRVPDTLITCARDAPLLHAATTSAVRTLKHFLYMFLLCLHALFLITCLFCFITCFVLFVYCLFRCLFYNLFLFYVFFPVSFGLQFAFTVFSSSNYMVFVLLYQNTPRFLFSPYYLYLSFNFLMCSCYASFITLLQYFCFFKYSLFCFFA